MELSQAAAGAWGDGEGRGGEEAPRSLKSHSPDVRGGDLIRKARTSRWSEVWFYFKYGAASALLQMSIVPLVHIFPGASFKKNETTVRDTDMMLCAGPVAEVNWDLSLKGGGPGGGGVSVHSGKSLQLENCMLVQKFLIQACTWSCIRKSASHVNVQSVWIFQMCSNPNSNPIST